MISLDKTYKTRKGLPVRVVCVDRKSTRSVIALVEEHGTEGAYVYTSDGKINTPHENDLDLIEVTPWSEFKIDEPVMVRNSGDEWRPRFFAGTSDTGLPCTWAHGATSWSTGPAHRKQHGWRLVWDECRRPTKEELEQ